MADEERNLNQPMRMQGVDPNKVKCKDCAFRDKTTVKIGDETIHVGIIKAYCKIYEKGMTNGKPSAILFQNENCKYYMKDDD